MTISKDAESVIRYRNGGEREKETLMGRPRKEWKNWDEWGTLWAVSDELWAQVAACRGEAERNVGS